MTCLCALAEFLVTWVSTLLNANVLGCALTAISMPTSKVMRSQALSSAYRHHVEWEAKLQNICVAGLAQLSPFLILNKLSDLRDHLA